VSNISGKHIRSNEPDAVSGISSDVKIIPVAEGAFNIRESLATGHKGLYVGRPVQDGEVISALGIREYVTTPNYLSVQFGEFEHGMLEPEHLQYINHSCSPNVFFDVQARHLRALRRIGPSDELCFFYPATEWRMTQSFHCHCNSAGCLGHIQGAAYLPESVLEQYELSGHVKKLMRRGLVA
jgi:SET domain